MAVTVSGMSSGSTVGAVSYTVNHIVPVGDNRMLLVFVSMNSAGAAGLVSVVSNKNGPLTVLKIMANAVDFLAIGLYAVLNPTVGSHTLTITHSLSREGGAVVLSLLGAAQALVTGLGSEHQASPATSTTSSLTLPDAGAGKLSLAAMVYDPTVAGDVNLTPIGGAAEYIEFNAGAGGEIDVQSLLAGGSLGWTWAPATALRWSIVGLVVAPAATTGVVPSPVGSEAGLVLAFAQRVSRLHITVATEAAAQPVLELPDVAFDGATPIEITFSCPLMSCAGIAWGRVLVRRNDTLEVLATLAQIIEGDGPLRIGQVLTPPAGTYRLQVCAWQDDTDYYLEAGNGGPGDAFPPIYAKIQTIMAVAPAPPPPTWPPSAGELSEYRKTIAAQVLPALVGTHPEQAAKWAWEYADAFIARWLEEGSPTGTRRVRTGADPTAWDGRYAMLTQNMPLQPRT